MTLSRIFAITILFMLTACQPGRQTASLPGTNWELVEIDGQPILAGTQGTLQFSADGASGGNAGCNRFGAQTTEIKGKSIRFKEIIQTEMACLDDANNTYTGLMDQESRYLQTLSRVREYQVDEKSLALLGEDGEKLLLFKAAAP